MKTAAQLVQEFETDVRKLVQRRWPSLVAHEAAVIRDQRKLIKTSQQLGQRAAARKLGMAETTLRDRLKKAYEAHT